MKKLQLNQAFGKGATHSWFPTSSDTHNPTLIITTGTIAEHTWAGNNLPDQNLIHIPFGSGELR
jgi:glucose dehydrogenase